MEEGADAVRSRRQIQDLVRTGPTVTDVQIGYRTRVGQ